MKWADRPRSWHALYLARANKLQSHIHRDVTIYVGPTPYKGRK